MTRLAVQIRIAESYIIGVFLGATMVCLLYALLSVLFTGSLAYLIVIWYLPLFWGNAFCGLLPGLIAAMVLAAFFHATMSVKPLGARSLPSPMAIPSCLLLVAFSIWASMFYPAAFASVDSWLRVLIAGVCGAISIFTFHRLMNQPSEERSPAISTAAAKQLRITGAKNW